jgi:hypothetical protein
MIVGGAASNLATATQYPQGFTYRKVAATEYLYYCGLDGGLYKITVGTGETALTLPVPGMKCQGSSVIYDTVRGSLIFPYNFQGMSGIAEYINP